MKARLLITSTLAVLSVLTARPQIPEMAKSQLSPTAAALGEYGDVPVSLFTGIPQVEIPLYELRCGEHSFPISLSYHGGGVRPDQVPGWMGQGWSLNAGGCVTRIVKQQPDEFDSSLSGISQNHPHTGFLYSHGILSGDNWNTYGSMLSHILDSSVNYLDTEPDEFSFNFLDYHGRFFLDHSGEWQVQCDRPVKVECQGRISPFTGMDNDKLQFADALSTESTDAILTFVLTGEDGTRYYFGESSERIEFSTDLISPHRDTFWATAWNLSRVVYADGRSVTLDYEQHYLGEFTTFEAQIGTSCSKVFRCSYNVGTNHHDGYSGGHVDTVARYQGSLVRPSYLRRITCGGEAVNFYRDRIPDMPYDLQTMLRPLYRRDYADTGNDPSLPGQSNDPISTFLPLVYAFSVEMDSKDEGFSRPDEKGDGMNNYSALKWFNLTGIDVTCGGETLRRFNFDYSYPQSRPFLTRVSETGGNGSPGRVYAMEYDRPDMLPVCGSGLADHWGFYNARHADLTSRTTYYNKRQPNPAVATIGALTRLTYPTGGYNRLEYEPHDFSVRVGQDHETCAAETGTAGGIRVRKIVSCPDAESDSVVKEYFYVRGFTPGTPVSALPSSGVLASNPMYMFMDYRPQGTGNHTSISMDVFSSQSVTPGNENAPGCHIGYSEVLERAGDGSLTRHRFSNFGDGDYGDLQADCVTQAGHVACEPYTSRKSLRGNLLSQTEYALRDGQLVPHRLTVHTYEHDRDIADEFVRAVKVRTNRVNVAGAVDVTYTESAAYRQHLGRLRAKADTVTTYDQAGHGRTVTREYGYNADNLACLFSESVPGGATTVKRVTYPSDTLRQDMRQAHVLDRVLEEKTYRRDGGETLTVSRTRYDYDVNMVRPSAIWAAKGDGAFEKRKAYLFDSYCNPVEEVTDSARHTVYVWGYGGRYIVAVIEDAALADVTALLGDVSEFAQTTAPDFARLAALRQGLPGSRVTTYRYRPAVGLVETVGPDGRSTTYDYDGLGRLVRVLDHEGNAVKLYDYHYNPVP